MPHPPNSAKVIIKMHVRSGIWQAQSTTVQLHRDAAVEEYSIPTPQDVFESEDFELVSFSDLKMFEVGAGSIPHSGQHFSSIRGLRCNL